MGIFLNSIAPYKKYKSIVTDTYFVDKTALIDELIPSLGKEKRFFCITRPRRFGKTVMANMIGAFFGRTEDDRKIFDHLAIAKTESYHKHLNKHDVFYIDFSELLRDCITYQQYITCIQDGLIHDLVEAYPELITDSSKAVWDILSEIFERTERTFIFVIDEWDAVFHMPFITDKDRETYLLFLKSLFKSKGYVELVYMTGILPIAKYSDGSELNMFAEYNMATKVRFSEYFGFLDEEVDGLFETYQKTTERPGISRDALRIWYDGYHTAAGNRLYNPRSVVYALSDNQLANYWTSSGTYDSIFGYIKDNVADVQDDLAMMISGEAIYSEILEYAATSMKLDTKDEIYSAMVVYGLLTYEDGYVSIPNKELTDSFAAMMKKEKSLGYIYQLASTSAKMLKYAHDTESPIFEYNSVIE